MEGWRIGGWRADAQVEGRMNGEGGRDRWWKQPDKQGVAEGHLGWLIG